MFLPPTFSSENLMEIVSICQSKTNESFFRIYPNPTSSYFCIEGKVIEPFNYKLVSLQGTQVADGIISSENQKIDISTLSPNMYFLLVGENVYKVVKTK